MDKHVAIIRRIVCQQCATGTVLSANNSLGTTLFSVTKSLMIIVLSVAIILIVNVDNIKDVSRIILRDIIQEKDLVDVLGTLQPDEVENTHYHKSTKRASIIDMYFFISSNLNNICDIPFFLAV